MKVYKDTWTRISSGFRFLASIIHTISATFHFLPDVQFLGLITSCSQSLSILSSNSVYLSSGRADSPSPPWGTFSSLLGFSESTFSLFASRSRWSWSTMVSRDSENSGGATCSVTGVRLVARAAMTWASGWRQGGSGR